MPIINLDLTGALAIDPGYEWRVEIVYPGNSLGLSLQGVIRESVQGQSLATFRFDNPTYDPAIQRTRIDMYLTNFQTRGLMPTGTQLYAYEVKIFLPGQLPQLLMAGSVQVNETFRG